MIQSQSICMNPGQSKHIATSLSSNSYYGLCGYSTKALSNQRHFHSAQAIVAEPARHVRSTTQQEKTPIATPELYNQRSQSACCKAMDKHLKFFNVVFWFKFLCMFTCTNHIKHKFSHDWSVGSLRGRQWIIRGSAGCVFGSFDVQILRNASTGFTDFLW